MPGMKFQTVSKFAAVIAVALGLGMMALGGIFIAMGLHAKGEVREALVKEQVITSSDTPILGYPSRMRRLQGHSRTLLRAIPSDAGGLTHHWIETTPGVIRTSLG